MLLTNPRRPAAPGNPGRPGRPGSPRGPRIDIRFEIVFSLDVTHH